MKSYKVAFVGVFALVFSILLSGCEENSSWRHTQLEHFSTVPIDYRNNGYFENRKELNQYFFKDIRPSTEEVIEARLRNAWLEFPNTDSRTGAMVADLMIEVNGSIVDRIDVVLSDRNGVFVIENDAKLNTLIDKIVVDIAYGNSVYMIISGFYSNQFYPLDKIDVLLAGEADVRVARY